MLILLFDNLGEVWEGREFYCFTGSSIRVLEREREGGIIMYGWCIVLFFFGGWWLDWIGLILAGFCFAGDGAVKGFVD